MRTAANIPLRSEHAIPQPSSFHLDDDATTRDATETLAPPALLLLFFWHAFCSDCNGSGGALRNPLWRL